MLCTAFIWLQFCFVTFWQKDFGKKIASKVLMKSTPGFKLPILNAKLWKRGKNLPLCVLSRHCCLLQKRDYRKERVCARVWVKERLSMLFFAPPALLYRHFYSDQWPNVIWKCIKIQTASFYQQYVLKLCHFIERHPPINRWYYWSCYNNNVIFKDSIMIQRFRDMKKAEKHCYKYMFII